MMRREAAAAAATAADPGEGRPALPDVAGVTEILADMQTRLLVFGVAPAVACLPSNLLLFTSSQAITWGLLLPVALKIGNLESALPSSGADPMRDSAEALLATCMDDDLLLLSWTRLLSAAASAALKGFTPAERLGVEAEYAVLAVVMATAAAGVLCPVRCFAATVDVSSGRFPSLDMASFVFSQPSGRSRGFGDNFLAAFDLGPAAFTPCAAPGATSTVDFALVGVDRTCAADAIPDLLVSVLFCQLLAEAWRGCRGMRGFGPDGS